MTDYLLDLGKNPLARRLVKRLSLPIPLPETLRRPDGPWDASPFASVKATVGSADRAPHRELLQDLLDRGGARAAAPSGDADLLAFDASGVATPEELATVYEFFHTHLGRLARSGKVVVLGLEPALLDDPRAAATQAALLGFVKSVAKEVGRKGATAQLLRLAPDLRGDAARAALAGPLTYFATARSAFVSGQALSLAKSDKSAAPAWPEVAPLAGKKAVVTGAAQGIGLAIAQKLAAEGAEVLGVDHPAESRTLEEAMRSLAVPGRTLTLDLAGDDAPQELARRIESIWGEVDVVVNTAGVTRDKMLTRMRRDAWDLTLRVNLRAPLELTEALLGDTDALFKLLAPGGRVILLSSISGIAGNAGQANYAAAKAGLLGYARQLAPRLATRGATVNAIAPGLIETRMTRAMPVALREVARRISALSQGGQPADVAEACAFFASPGSAAVTGQVLRVCGLSLVGA